MCDHRAGCETRPVPADSQRARGQALPARLPVVGKRVSRLPQLSFPVTSQGFSKTLTSSLVAVYLVVHMNIESTNLSTKTLGH